MATENLVDLPFFKENGFYKKKCRVCGKLFWTLDPNREVCGDQPCVDYDFIDKPVDPSFGGVREVREAFLSFFEKHGHTRVRRYPVVARWRTDVYLVGASIYDFQPWVTEGIVDPPANPLVISQPSIRLTDVDNVGRSGRHMTGFEMMAHHAFNVRGAKVYWADETVRYAFELFTKVYGIPEEEVTFKFDWWSGGGNAGEDYEVLVRGLEVATLVFMHYKVVDDKPIPMENRIVDTGYGLERILWLLKGGYSVYEVVFPDIIAYLRKVAGIEELPRDVALSLARRMGRIDYKEPEKAVKVKREVAQEVGLTISELDKLLAPHEAVWAVADHTRTIMWMIGDGVVPSNVGSGYLARLLIRRAIRHLMRIGYPVPLAEVVARQIEAWRGDFPEYAERADDILDIVSYEESRYKETLEKGRKVVARTVRSLLKRGMRKLPYSELVKLYESHGVTPDVVVEEASKLGVEVEAPPDFYSKLAKGREQAPKVEKLEKFTVEFAEKVSGYPETRKLYYEDPYLFEFEAKVLGLIDGTYLVLDQTAFYPEGGGQPSDIGYLEVDGRRVEVEWVGKVGGVVVHKLKEPLEVKPGTRVHGVIDAERRKALMRHHTATHIILGAAKRVLGPHVWQAGAQKGVDQSRLDITHHKRVTEEEVREIERLANRVVMENRPVRTYFMDRNEAEAKHGFVLYQGGVVPEPVLRVVEVEGWDVEACGGTHVRTTGEVGLIKIVKVERIQDGVSRIVFKAGEAALKHVQDQEALLRQVGEVLGADVSSLAKRARDLVERSKELEKRLARLTKQLIEQKAAALTAEAVEAGPYRVIVHEESGISRDEARDLAIEIARRAPDSVVLVLIPVGAKSLFALKLGDKVLEAGLNAAELAKKLTADLGGKGGGVRDLAQGFLPGTGLRDRALESLRRLLTLG